MVDQLEVEAAVVAERRRGRAGSRSPCWRRPGRRRPSRRRRSAARWRWCGSTRSTRPTRPSLLSTVMSGWTPASEPASMVTVRENDWDGPEADHAGRRPARSRGLVGGARSGRRTRRAGCGRSRRCATSERSSAFSASSAATRRAASRWSRNQSGDGRERAGRPRRCADSTGPKTSPTARRAGLDRRVVAAAGSRVIRVTRRPSTSATSSARGRRRSRSVEVRPMLRQRRSRRVG